MDLKFSTYVPIIRRLTMADISGPEPHPSLLMDRDGVISIYYAPFDAINRDARIILAGITPGRTQMDESLRTAAHHLSAGLPEAEVLLRTKEAASFAGSMRANLVAMLDRFRIHEVLGISTCAELFGASRHLVHYTSALRYPVFVKGVNYNGAPAMTRHPLLSRYLLEHFAAELEALPRAIVVPLGEKVSDALEFIAHRQEIGRQRILSGMEHPSGANNERIAYLLGRKSRERLSPQVRPDRIDRARIALEAKVAELLTG